MLIYEQRTWRCFYNDRIKHEVLCLGPIWISSEYRRLVNFIDGNHVRLLNDTNENMSTIFDHVVTVTGCGSGNTRLPK